MIMPIALQVHDLEVNHLYLVAVVGERIGVSFQARLLVIERPLVYDNMWVFHFSGGLTLQLTKGCDATFFEVLEEI